MTFSVRRDSDDSWLVRYTGPTADTTGVYRAGDLAEVDVLSAGLRKLGYHEVQ
jgi:hypothetical protein